RHWRLSGLYRYSWKIADDIWRDVARGLSECRDRRRDSQRLSGAPVEDAAQLPSLRQALRPRRRVGKKHPARTDWQFERTVADEVVRAMKTEQRLIERTITRVTI